MLPNLKKKNDFKSIISISFLISILLVIISVIAILALFPTTLTREISTSNNLSTIYLITRRVQLNSFIEQTDILFLVIWIFSIFGYIAFLSYGILHVLNKLFTFENKKPVILPVASIILGFCLLTNKFSTISFLESSIFKYFSILLIRNLFYCINSWKSKKKEEINKKAI